MKIKKILIILTLLNIVPLISFAHSGRTDSYGGHYSSTGYHYHHGYEAHPHINGYCPFDSNLSDWLPSNCPSCQATINPINGYCCFECGFDISEQYGLTMLALVDGPVSKTRSEYFQEVNDLEDKIDLLKSQNEELIYENEQLKLQHQQEIRDIKSENSSITFFWVVITICSSCFFYHKGKNK